jgi:hypothetical protein
VGWHFWNEGGCGDCVAGVGMLDGIGVGMFDAWLVILGVVFPGTVDSSELRWWVL